MLFLPDTTPAQVFKCPTQDVQGNMIATIGATAIAAWNNVYGLLPDNGFAAASSTMNIYGQLSSVTPFNYGFSTVRYQYYDNPLTAQTRNIAFCTFFVTTACKYNPVFDDDEKRK